MTTKYNNSIFLFTRDLRLKDNTTLNDILENSENVLPIFILDKRQITEKNSFRSINCIQFMFESLQDLNNQLKEKNSKLYIFYGITEKIIEKLLKNNEFDCIGLNFDYTPFAVKRQNKIKKLSESYECDFINKEDYMLTGVDKALKLDGSIYVKFTPYHRIAKNVKIDNIKIIKKNNFIKNINNLNLPKLIKIDKIFDEMKIEKNENLNVNGGTKIAEKILNNLDKFNNYNDDRNHPSLQTTLLSAYNKFGCVSIRQVYHKFKKYLKNSNSLFTQLYWRDFYYTIAFHNPHIFKGAMNQNYDKIIWENDSTKFKKWKKGLTGIPIVDAGMRQMNNTGYMHNRCRMIVSNYLIKILRIDWRKGEKYFAQTLVDYDPSQNNGGWQWSSSSGTDSQPYFRIFNPWRQSENFDKNCEYIKFWIPELKEVENKDIHKWYEKYSDYDVKYPKPITLDIKSETKKTISMYKKIY